MGNYVTKWPKPAPNLNVNQIPDEESAESEAGYPNIDPFPSHDCMCSRLYGFIICHDRTCSHTQSVYYLYRQMTWALTLSSMRKREKRKDVMMMICP